MGVLSNLVRAHPALASKLRSAALPLLRGGEGILGS